MNTFDIESVMSGLVQNDVSRVRNNMIFEGARSDSITIENVIYNMLYDDIQEDIAEKYEAVYQCLCARYSDSYLKGSDFYVGDILENWWIEKPENCEEKLMKWVKIKETLDSFLK